MLQLLYESCILISILNVDLRLIEICFSTFSFYLLVFVDRCLLFIKSPSTRLNVE